MSLARISHLSTLPEQVYRTRPVQSLENSAMDAACLLNDMFSYRKEIEFEGEVHNAVLVVRNFLGCSQERAFEMVSDLMTARVKQFEHVVEHELPALVTDFGLAEGALESYVEELRDWLGGHPELAPGMPPLRRRRPAAGGIVRTGAGGCADRPWHIRGAAPGGSLNFFEIRRAEPVENATDAPTYPRNCPDGAARTRRRRP